MRNTNISLPEVIDEKAMRTVVDPYILYGIAKFSRTRKWFDIPNVGFRKKNLEVEIVQYYYHSLLDLYTPLHWDRNVASQLIVNTINHLYPRKYAPITAPIEKTPIATPIYIVVQGPTTLRDSSIADSRPCLCTFAILLAH